MLVQFRVHTEENEKDFFFKNVYTKPICFKESVFLLPLLSVIGDTLS